MVTRSPSKSTAINSTDNVNKQGKNQDIALELVVNYLASGAYKNKNLSTIEEPSGQALANAARMDAYYMVYLYTSTKEWLNKLDIK